MEPRKPFFHETFCHQCPRCGNALYCDVIVGPGLSVMTAADGTAEFTVHAKATPQHHVCGGFYEEDEPVERVKAAFDTGTPGLTAPSPSASATVMPPVVGTDSAPHKPSITDHSNDGPSEDKGRADHCYLHEPWLDSPFRCVFCEFRTPFHHLVVAHLRENHLGEFDAKTRSDDDVSVERDRSGTPGTDYHYGYSVGYENGWNAHVKASRSSAVHALEADLLADAIDCIEGLKANSPTWTDTEVEQTLRRLRVTYDLRSSSADSADVGDTP